MPSGSSTSSSSGGTSSFAGKWTGPVGQDSSHLDLQQNGATVTGQACEAPGKDCYAFSGEAAGDRLTGSYSWMESGKTEKVVVDLRADGNALVGKYTVSKCMCTLDASLQRQ